MTRKRRHSPIHGQSGSYKRLRRAFMQAVLGGEMQGLLSVSDLYFFCLLVIIGHWFTSHWLLVWYCSCICMNPVHFYATPSATAMLWLVPVGNKCLKGNTINVWVESQTHSSTKTKLRQFWVNMLLFFSTGSKCEPVSNSRELHGLTQAACSYMFLFGQIAIY